MWPAIAQVRKIVKRIPIEKNRCCLLSYSTCSFSGNNRIRGKEKEDKRNLWNIETALLYRGKLVCLSAILTAGCAVKIQRMTYTDRAVSGWCISFCAIRIPRFYERNRTELEQCCNKNENKLWHTWRNVKKKAGADDTCLLLKDENEKRNKNIRMTTEKQVLSQLGRSASAAVWGWWWLPVTAFLFWIYHTVSMW